MHSTPQFYAQFLRNRGELLVNGVDVDGLGAVVVPKDVLEEAGHVDGGSRRAVRIVVESDGERSEPVLGEKLDLVEEQIAEAEAIDVVLHGDVLLGDEVADGLVDVHALRERERRESTMEAKKGTTWMLSECRRDVLMKSNSVMCRSCGRAVTRMEITSLPPSTLKSGL